MSILTAWLIFICLDVIIVLIIFGIFCFLCNVIDYIWRKFIDNE